MDSDKPEKKADEMLLIDWLTKATATQIAFHTSGNKLARSRRGQPAKEVR